MDPKEKQTGIEQLLAFTSPENRDEAARLLDELLADRSAALEQARFALNRTGDAVFWINRDAEFSYVNETAVKTLGYTLKKLLTLSVPDIDPDFPKEAWSAFWQKLREKGFMQFESRHRTKDGKIFPVEVSATLIRSADQEVVCAFARDITDRKASEDDLRTREENYRLLVENQTDLVVKVDPEGRFLFASPSYLDLFDKTGEELIGDTFLPLVHEEDRAASEKQFLACLEPPYTSLTEQRAMTRHGWRWLAWTDTAVLDTDGKVIAVIGAGRDITDQKLAEEKLRASRQRLSSHIEHTPMGAIEWDLDWNIIGWNPAARHIFGYADDTAIGQHASLLIPDMEREQVNQILEDVLTQRAGFHNINHNITQDGRIILCDWYNTVLTDENGKNTGVASLVMDITEHERNKQSLQESETRYRELFEQSTDALLIVKDGEFVDCNQATADMFRSPSTESICHTHPHDLSPETQPDGRPSLEKSREMLENAVRNKNTLFEWVHKRADGEVFPAEVSLTAITDSDGNPAVHATVRDITARKEAEKAIRTEQNLFQSFMETLPASVYFKDLDSRFVRINQVCADLFGTEKNKIIGQTDSEFFPEEDAQKRRDDEVRVMETGQPTQREEYWNGRWLLTTKAPRYDENDILEGTFGVALDITEKKRAQQDLEESRRLLWSIIDTMPGRVWWKDLDSVFLGCNLNFAHDAGLDHPRDLIGKTDYDMCWKEQADSFVADDREVITSAVPKLGFEEFQTQADGHTRWLETSKIPLRNREGTIIGTLGTYADITERKLMQEAIQKRIIALTRPLDQTDEVAFEELFDLNEIQHMQDEFSTATGVASIITRPDGTPITEPSNFTSLCFDIIRKTEKGCANCYKSDAVIGRYHPDGPIVQQCLSGGLWDAGASITVGGRHIANWLIGQVRDETQTDEAMRAYAREIGADVEAFMDAFYRVPVMPHERFEHIASALSTLANQLSTSAYQNIQQARFIAGEKHRMEELHRLSTAIEQSPETVMITDTEGIIEYVNPAFETTSGYSREEALGQDTTFLKSGRHDPSFFDDMWNTISSGETWENRFVNKRKDGSIYTEEAVISPVADPSGTITHFVAIKRDITAELVKEEQFLQSQKMESVGQLAGGIAHDFNNMLQVIQGFSEILLSQLTGGSAEHRNTEEIQKAANRAAELTRKLLVFSRKEPIERKEINLNDTVRDTSLLLGPLLGETIQPILHLEKDLAPIQADHGQITQVIMNLAVNARDAMPAGGRLTISTENVYLDERDIADKPDVKPGPFICLAITDTGCGMNQEVKDHLFEPFFTTKEVGKGTGLGLSVIYGIVKQNKGMLHVYSEENLGTTIRMYLPALSGDRPGEVHEMSGTARRECILLVEDDWDVRDVVVNILATSGYAVTTATTAEEALSLFENPARPFIMLFSDIVLPGKSGLELADLLKEKEPGLPVLLCSGYRDQRERWKTIDQKGYHFLQKPFTVSSLLSAVNDTLNGSKG